MFELDKFLENKLMELNKTYSTNKEVLYLHLYEQLELVNLKNIFIKMHAAFNELFTFMNHKNNYGGNGHYNAFESRQLISLIEYFKILKANLYTYSISINCDENYQKVVDECNTFLSSSGGSTIPEGFERISIIDSKPIFTLGATTVVQSSTQRKLISMNLIGEGSYAHVYKFKDFNNGFYLVQKRAKSGLTTKELARFKKEFEDIQQLDSPFIVKAYSFNDDEKSYTMEFIDENLDKYISKRNNQLNLQKRKTMIVQLLQGFKYMHSKSLLHRDISYKNILVKTYEDGTDIIKIADLGLVKRKNSDLTNTDSDIKGSINDFTDLERVGFKNYSIEHETYALTKIIYFILTGKTSNYHKESNDGLKNFLEKGLASDKSLRFKSIQEIQLFLNSKVYPKLNDKEKVLQHNF